MTCGILNSLGGWQRVTKDSMSVYSCDSQQGTTWSPKGHLMISGELLFFNCRDLSRHVEVTGT